MMDARAIFLAAGGGIVGYAVQEGVEGVRLHFLFSTGLGRRVDRH
jgi:hypothetical protein